jgi:pimeloyl-ACP methyl ester carboxylesterase
MKYLVLMMALLSIIAFAKNTVTSKSYTAIEGNSLPADSQLLKINNRNVHVRTMGEKNNKPTVILLAGPNENWHSDSAWFALLQPILARNYHVISIDRAGHGWSDFHPEPSYQLFAQDLAIVIKQLKLDNIILLNYASSNISSLLLLKNNPEIHVKAMLWIDPDILLPHSIALYTAAPANWYQKNIAKILPHIADGKWTEKTQKRNQNEIALIQTLIPETLQSSMQWDYFRTVQEKRESIIAQQTRALEIANYAKDLASVEQLPIPTNLPITVINSDFELANSKETDENYSQLQQWQNEGSAWSKKVATTSHGQYIEINNADHLVIFQHPEIINAALNKLVDKL